MSIIIEHIVPPKSFRMCVERFWHITCDEDSSLRVVPDAGWDIVINHGGEPEFVGPMSTAFTIPLVAGTRHYGVRFKPGTYFTVLGKPMEAFLDEAVELSELVEASSTGEPLSRLMTLVNTLIQQELLITDTTVQRLLVAISDPSVPIASACAQAGLSLSTAERKCKYYVGLTPNEIRRVMRQLKINEALLKQNQQQLGNLAADFNYVDQAHMTKELKKLSGATPAALKREYDDYVQYKTVSLADTTTSN